MKDHSFLVIETHMYTPLFPGKDVSLGLEGWPFWLNDLIRLSRTPGLSNQLRIVFADTVDLSAIKLLAVGTVSTYMFGFTGL
jgi:hypothetical protein